MNSRKSWIRVAAVAASGLLFLTACSSSDETATETSAAATTEETATEEAAAECTELTPVTLQLQWFVQAQFGGYYAAKDLGYYEEQCLDVTILEGGVDIVPQTVTENATGFPVVDVASTVCELLYILVGPLGAAGHAEPFE